jgi:hypothetical protein
MIRALHLTGVMSLAGACLVTGLCIFRIPHRDFAGLDAVFAGVNAPRQAAENAGVQIDQKEDSALVQAARQFALYLNPPAPAEVTRETPIPEKRSQRVAKAEPQIVPETTSPKFELRGISYHQSRPEESMALIAVPGAGSSWVRQGDRIGHTVVDKINGDSIECKDGERVLALSLTGQKAPTVVANSREAREKKPAPASKNNTPAADAAPRPLLVRGMRQIPLVRLTSNPPQNASGSQF